MSILVAVDAGHGGYDNGASFEGRLEKDDNLRLARALRDSLIALGQRVLMTRDEDVYITLANRAEMANEANADFFVSLHRNSYDYETPATRGVDAYIYTTAPQSYEVIARTILDNIVKVGVQADNGVKRANFYVLRETQMPSTLLEMGFIINAEDNRLFDRNLYAYADAIAYGISEALGAVPYVPGGDPVIRAVQQRLNSTFAAGIIVTGIYGPETKRALIKSIQITLNRCCNAELTVDGVWGPATSARMWTLFPGSRGDIVWAMQAALYGIGYNPGQIDGIYGRQTTEAVRRFQRDRGLTPDGTAGRQTLSALFG